MARAWSCRAWRDRARSSESPMLPGGRERSARKSEVGRSSRASFRSGLIPQGALGNEVNSIWALRKAVRCSAPGLRGVLMVMLDLRPMGQRRVDGAVAIARHVQRLCYESVVVLAVPADMERHVDLRESARPLLLLLAFDLDLHRLQRLLELLQQQHRVEPCAAAKRSEQHLGRTHRGVVAEDRRLIDGGRMTRSGLD